MGGIAHRMRSMGLLARRSKRADDDTNNMTCCCGLAETVLDSCAREPDVFAPAKNLPRNDSDVRAGTSAAAASAANHNPFDGARRDHSYPCLAARAVGVSPRCRRPKRPPKKQP